MKIALITTTINIPKVLSLYRTFDESVEFFITGDKKTPHEEVRNFVRKLGNARYYAVEDQEKLGYRSSEIIGWNKIMRRNIALLEAVRSGADLIVTIDDDNIPCDANYFADFRRLFAAPFNGLMAAPESGWFDIGGLLTPTVFHRGFPYDRRGPDRGYRMSPVTGAKIGVAAGLWMGDPDIDAMQRLTNGPMVLSCSELIRSGLTVSPSCMTVFNSQNTAFLRALAPLLMVWISVGRYDDIWAAYVTQRIMREEDYAVHFGRPFVWQERNVQNLWNNLRDEVMGMETTPRFVRDLNDMELGGGGVLERLRALYRQLGKLDYIPKPCLDLGEAWCADFERIAA
jgi:Reversibly glycosylated polypeptide